MTSTSYKESRDGAEALASLDWTRVLARNDWCAFARWLLTDLAETLGPPAVDLPAGGRLPDFGVFSPRRQHMLRNL